jgi:hypothetical protein
MNVNIDLERLKSEGLTPDEYCILYCLYRRVDPAEFMSVTNVYDNLVALKYIRENPDVEGVYNLTGTGLKLFEKPDDFMQFVDEYRNLFPKGVKSGNGTPIRGDKNGIIKKLTWFLMTYPEFSKRTILEATRLYVEQMRMNNYMYMTQADYFIQKAGGSKLASLCEDFDNKTAHILSTGEKRI